MIQFQYQVEEYSPTFFIKLYPSITAILNYKNCSPPSMKLTLSILICIIAIILYKDSILIQLEHLLEDSPLSGLLILYYNPAKDITAQKTFEGLPVLPLPHQQPPQKPSNMSVPRGIIKAFLAVEQSEGVGARVRRSIGTRNLKNFSPFLMLDYFSISNGAGFPDHPHRGQETITYLLKGAVDHEDFAGNSGTIESGDLQFMTAGRGIV
jgi:quercetin 2,3-dioxygenase